MKIDGVKIANKVLSTIEKKLKEENKTPTLAIILIGNDPASKSYVKEKIKKANAVGVETTLITFKKADEKQLTLITDKLNKNKSIKGIIIQRPLPKEIDEEVAVKIVETDKDVDGFRDDSNFESPISQAVFEILRFIHSKRKDKKNLENWLKTLNIVVIGKGQTGGRPIKRTLEKKNIKFNLVDTKTKNSSEIYKKADLIITTVGKPKILNSKNIKKGVILIGVGMKKSKTGHFEGDYEENEIKDIASYYTPIPGGVGPVNVAMLLKNLL